MTWFLFYATSPVKGLVGYGYVTATFAEHSPPWADEVAGDESKWPFRIRLERVHSLAESDWQLRKISVDPGLVGERSVQSVPEADARLWSAQVQD